LNATARAGGLVVALALACAACATPVQAQLAGSNLLLFQLGNWPPSMPDRGTPDRESFYDRLDVQYVSATVLAGLRFETDRNSDLENEYAGFTQRFVDWQGIPSVPMVSAPALGLIALAVLVVATAIAVVPAQVAARTSPADALRAE